MKKEFEPVALVVGGVMLFGAGVFATMSVYEFLLYIGVI